VSTILRQMGYQVKTADYDETVKPDYLTDVRKLSSIVKERFGLILCCEILEHIPFHDVPSVLTDCASLSRKYLIVTLPYTSFGTFKPRLYMKIVPFFKPLKWIKIFNFFPKKHVLNREGGHQWEIGKKGYPLTKIFDMFQSCGWRIIRHYPIFENPYHYVIVCEKK
jgi:hypothetical protein